MSNKYHISKETDRAGICHTTKKGWPLGDDTPHFASIHDTNSYIERVERKNNQTIISHNKVSKILIK